MGKCWVVGVAGTHGVCRHVIVGMVILGSVGVDSRVFCTTERIKGSSVCNSRGGDSSGRPRRGMGWGKLMAVVYY
jgi:hypothetical protein